MKDFLWVFSFLTIIPNNRKWFTGTPNIRNVIFWFPIVGLLIGLSLAIVYFLLTKAIPFAVADAATLTFYFLLTGGLHLDGLADTCDGIFGGKDKVSRLKIMRDSSIGSFGVIGLICLIGIKYLCVNSICSNTLIPADPVSFFSVFHIDPGTDLFCTVRKCVILFLMPSIGRWTQTLGASVSGYAREGESGTGMLIIQKSKLYHAIYSAFIPFVLICGFFGVTRGLIIFSLMCALPVIFVKFIKSKIGGMTGDTLGALNELSEIIFLAVFLF
ncbi:MAG: adenosylcobinamide-GDP ribazoletransferase [Candidatus Anammoxibacter sp.]